MKLIIMPMVILNRSRELAHSKQLGPWLYICGRRKTGKTFFVQNFQPGGEYFFVRRDGTLLTADNRALSYETFWELFQELIQRKRVIIDEFHRLPEEFFDYLHALGKKGTLTVISSTLWFSQKLLGQGSPLLGLFSLLIFSLVDERDVLLSLPRTLTGQELIEAAIYLREPLLAASYQPPLRHFLPEFLNANKLALNEIIGEIFSEEQRQISSVYEGIMRAVAAQKNVSTEISSYLFSKKIIPKDNPGYIQKYLGILVKIGILEKVEVWGKAKFVYRHCSPLFDLHFYLEEKYGYGENNLPTPFIRKVVEERIPHHAERFFENLLAQEYGLKKVAIEQPEIDIALVEFKKVKLIAEVKWKKQIDAKDLAAWENKLSLFKEARKLLIVPERKLLKSVPAQVEVIDVENLLKMVKKGLG